MAWVEEKIREGGAPGVPEERKERGRALGEVEGSVGPDGACDAASLRARHAVSVTHGQSVREVQTVRPLWTETSLLSSNSKLDLPSLQKFHKNLC
jgi:hypothetical protein